jgi:hypothetical protein
VRENELSRDTPAWQTVLFVSLKKERNVEHRDFVFSFGHVGVDNPMIRDGIEELSILGENSRKM